MELLSSNLIIFLLFPATKKIFRRCLLSCIFSSIPHFLFLPPPSPKSLDKLTPTSPALYSPRSPPPPLSVLFFFFAYPPSTVTQINRALSSPLAFLARILFTSVPLITGRASLDLTDVAIIQGISWFNTWAYLGSWPGSEAPSAPSEFDPFSCFTLRWDLAVPLHFDLWFLFFLPSSLACWCCFIQIGALSSHLFSYISAWVKCNYGAKLLDARRGLIGQCLSSSP